jgi:hypothetical protein
MKLSNNMYATTLQELTLSLLPLADFTIFNETYTPSTDGCYTCNASGGFVGSEYQGDPPMDGMVNTFDVCNECIGDEKCPGCMQPLALSFDLSAFESKTEWIAYDNPYYATNLGYLLRTFDYEDALEAMPFEGFVCSCCGWSYDPDRHYDNEPDYDDGDYDYPALDASDMFPF